MPTTADDRLAARAREQADTSATIFAATPDLDLPGIGKVTVRFRNRDLAEIERRLTPLLEELPDDLRFPVDEATGRRSTMPYANVWDAIDVLVQRFPLLTVGTLLETGLRHDRRLDVTAIEDLPPRVFTDEATMSALGEAIRVAFGGTSSEEATAGPTGAA